MAELCNVKIPEADKLQWYVPRPKMDSEAAIRMLCEPLLADMGEAYRARFEYELSVIRQSEPIMNSYLVAWQIIDWCRQQGIPAYGRGSMAGSLVSNLLGITVEDPIKHNLLFERAVNPARPTIPDFDLDVSSKGRARVLEYIAHTFKSSAPIATYSEHSPKGASRKVMRDRGYPMETQNRVSKALSDNWETWEAMEEAVPAEARAIVQGYQGLLGSLSVHAAGIAVGGADRPLESIAPMAWVASSKTLVSQYDMYSLKKLGVFKLDILGSATADQLTQMELLTGARPPGEYNDAYVIDAFQRGKTCEIFQLDGYAARSVISQIGINEFEDLVAVNALCRPGANQFVDTYRAGSTKLADQYPPLAPVLGYTRGVILYQEQVMEICKVLAGFDDAEQDDIKEAIKYFRDEVFAAIEPRFMQGCVERGHHGAAIFQAIKQFAGYAFNRAHAVSYSAIAYRMQWYKVHHPAAFYASVFDDSDDKKRLLLESHTFGVRWSLPDVNASQWGTTLRGDTVVMGLSGIKGIGPAVSGAILKAREQGPFANLEDLEARIEKRHCNVRHRAVLMDVGAMGSLGLGGEPGKAPELLGFSPEMALPMAAEVMQVNNEDYLGGYVTEARSHVIQKGRWEGRTMGYLTLVNARREYTVLLFPEAWGKYHRATKGKLPTAGLVFEGEWGDKGEFIAKHGYVPERGGVDLGEPELAAAVGARG